MNEQHTGASKSVDFKLEQYKYILQQRQTLNDNVHKYLALFQTLITGIAGAGVAIFVGWKELKIDAAVAVVSIKGLLWLLIILASFVVMSILSTIFSWFDNRKEEVTILNKEIAEGHESPPHWKNFWRWHETYFLVFIIVVVVTIYYFIEFRVLPLVK
jgi:hypothetical protein